MAKRHVVQRRPPRREKGFAPERKLKGKGGTHALQIEERPRRLQRKRGTGAPGAEAPRLGVKPWRSSDQAHPRACWSASSTRCSSPTPVSTTAAKKHGISVPTIFAWQKLSAQHEADEVADSPFLISYLDNVSWFHRHMAFVRKLCRGAHRPPNSRSRDLIAFRAAVQCADRSAILGG